MKILGIETSCDETSVAVVEDGKKILSNIIYSQVPLHKEFSGVVPELASRKHLEIILPLIKDALMEANLTLNDVDAISVTQEPGLMGSLLVGLTVAKTLAYITKKPLIPVNHINAHLYAANLEYDIPFPFIGLIVSGGHTLLTVWKNWLDYKILGTTIDDAVGEAFDKVAKLMNLGYPGGPIIDKLFKKGDANSINFPLVMLNKNNDRYNFSYSGLKTAVVYYMQRNENYVVEDVAASFQKKAIDVLFKKTKLLSEDLNINNIVIAGGVAANSYLREVFHHSKMSVFIPSIKLCTDNAAMVGGLAYHLYQNQEIDYTSLDAVDKIITPQIKRNLRKEN